MRLRAFLKYVRDLRLREANIKGQGQGRPVADLSQAARLGWSDRYCPLSSNAASARGLDELGDQSLAADCDSSAAMRAYDGMWGEGDRGWRHVGQGGVTFQ
jgi:hypothetical protein